MAGPELSTRAAVHADEPVQRFFDADLSTDDPEVARAIRQEFDRQQDYVGAFPEEFAQPFQTVGCYSLPVS